jgi:hypothetical protein
VEHGNLNRARPDQPCEPGLTRAVAPDLGEHARRKAERLAGSPRLAHQGSHPRFAGLERSFSASASPTSALTEGLRPAATAAFAPAATSAGRLTAGFARFILSSYHWSASIMWPS